MQSLHPIFTRFQSFQCPGANFDAHQAQGGVAHCSRHSPYLAIFALADHYLQPLGGDSGAAAYRWIALPEFGCGNQAYFGRLGNTIIQRYALAQLRQGIAIGRPFHLHPVGFGLFMGGMSNVMLQIAVVGKQQEPFGVMVQAPGGINIGNTNILSQGGAFLFRCKLRKDAKRLVEQD